MNHRPPFLTALFHPLNLSMFALMAAASLCSAWWLAPIGFVFWLVMVFIVARDPGLQINFARQSREPLSQRFQTRFDRLDRARVSIFNALQGVSPAFRRQIQPTQDTLDELVEHAYQLCANMSAINNNLYMQKLSNNFDDDIAAMKKNIDGAASEKDKRGFAEAIQSLETRKQQLKNIETLLSRFEAQLTGINNTVDSVVTGITSLKGRDAKYAEGKVPPLLQLLQTEQAELKQFDEEISKTPLV
jgi:archaellum component FlaC